MNTQKIKITDVRLETVDDINCVCFKINGIEWIEWTNTNRNGTISTEKTDSNLKCHYEGDKDVHDILEHLDNCINKL
jgi:hypothetical protein